MNLTQKVFIALIAGAVVGLALNLSGAAQEGSFLHTNVVTGLFELVGKLFINALKMLVVPLVFVSLVPGIVGIGDISLLGRVGIKAFSLYILTTAIAITLGISIASFFGIGKGLTVTADADFSGREAPPLIDVFTNIIPSNPIAAMANGDMLSIIFFAIVFGVSLLAVKKESPDLILWIDQANKVMMKMVTLVMHFAPYAVFCLMGKAMAELGLELFGKLIAYVVVLVAVLLLHGGVVLGILLKVFARVRVISFYKKIRSAQMFAFSTASSAATIPATMQAVQQRMGVDRSVSSFTVPLGATINMDGTAIMQGVATVFIANIYGIELGFSGFITVIVMAVLASIGTAAVPGVGLVMLTLVFNQVGLPVEGIGLVLGVDRLLDMVRTAVNITGDAAVTTIVAKSEGKFDQEIFDDDQAGVVTD